MMLKLKTVEAFGSRITYTRSALRSFSTEVLCAFSLGLSELVSIILIGVGRKRQTLHDLIAKTEVRVFRTAVEVPGQLAQL